MASTLAQEISLNQINIQTIEPEKEKTSTPIPIYTAGINELELQANRSNQEDLRQISKILKQILMYPDLQCTEMHIRAMKLGNFDLQDQPPPMPRLDTSSSMLSQKSKNEFCPCCGFKIQNQNIAICHPFDKIKNMGLSTFLFFATFKNLSILLVIMLVIYSGFALATNVLAANLLSQAGAINYSKIDYINISLSSKQTYDTQSNRMYYYISCWLGVAMAIIWLLVICSIKHTEIKDSNQYDQDTISCSDYSIVIEGVPLNVTQQQLQKQFDQYFQISVKNSSRFPQIWKQPLKIVKINIGKPFYLHEDQLKDQEIEQIDKEIAQIKEKVAEWIIQRRNFNAFRVEKGQRESTYQRYTKLIQNRNKKCLQLSNKVTSILKKDDGKREDLTNVFVTFQLNNNKALLNFIHDSGILSRIRAICNPQHQRFVYKQDEKEYKVHLARAPEPEDILWTNIGQKNCTNYMKKFFTFTITAILLGISFAIVFGLTKLQQSKNDDRMISIAISLTISIVNAVIGQVIRVLTVFEKDYTETNRQASLTIKSILAQMVNAIIIPVVSAYKITGNLYHASGLVDNIFMLSISISLIPPIIVFIDPYNFFMKIKRCFKSVPTRKLYQTQKEHNALQEGIEFEVGYQYIYPVNVFIFSCYFVSLQPIVALIGMVGYFLMYWAQKYCLFNRYRRPVPGTDFVNNAVYKIILLGPFIFGLGSMTWSNFTPGGIPQEALLPNLVIIGISVIIFIIPYNTLLMGWCFSNNYERNKKFDDERIIFPSQYDRLNPYTQLEGVQDYKKYLQRKVKEIQLMPKEKQAQFAQQYMMNAQRAQTVQRGNNAVYGNMQYQPVQMMQPYQQMPFMGMAPFASGFNMMPFKLPGMPFAPPMPFQPYPQMQMRPQQPPRPMVNQAYPSPGMVMPPPVVYHAQPIHNARPMQNLPPMMQQPPPHQNHNSMMLPNNSRQNLPPPQMNFPMNPVAMLANQGVKMMQNPSSQNLGFQPGNGNKGPNRGW